MHTLPLCLPANLPLSTVTRPAQGVSNPACSNGTHHLLSPANSSLIFCLRWWLKHLHSHSKTHTWCWFLLCLILLVLRTSIFQMCPFLVIPKITDLIWFKLFCRHSTCSTQETISSSEKQKAKSICWASTAQWDCEELICAVITTLISQFYKWGYKAHSNCTS